MSTSDSPNPIPSRTSSASQSLVVPLTFGISFGVLALAAGILFLIIFIRRRSRNGYGRNGGAYEKVEPFHIDPESGNTRWRTRSRVIVAEVIGVAAGGTESRPQSTNTMELVDSRVVKAALSNPPAEPNNALPLSTTTDVDATPSPKPKVASPTLTNPFDSPPRKKSSTLPTKESAPPIIPPYHTPSPAPTALTTTSTIGAMTSLFPSIMSSREGSITSISTTASMSSPWSPVVASAHTQSFTAAHATAMYVHHTPSYSAKEHRASSAQVQMPEPRELPKSMRPGGR